VAAGRTGLVGAALLAGTALAAALIRVPDSIAFALHVGGGALIGLGLGRLAGGERRAAAALAALAVVLGALAAAPLECHVARVRRAAELQQLFSTRLVVGALDLAEATYAERNDLARYDLARCSAARFGLARDRVGLRDRATAGLLGLTVVAGAALAARLARRPTAS
jgi:hypothetical protein